ncbi:hypothetical protein X798_01554 [Onchocerca flexuosa]|uniref:Uncharacterized protein n=1 Tax=Onchocerca flexuosa TaxID=387005 RepID=A0A238C2K0_9BILA|nr:hypothetical protein X798_01554 [Onchocerca flexuosa]
MNLIPNKRIELRTGSCQGLDIKWKERKKNIYEKDDDDGGDRSH